MFQLRRIAAAREAMATRAALDRSLAVIEFGMDGTILTANTNFLGTFGYTLDEVRGKHHSLFVDAAERDRPTYTAFWDRLRRGDAQVAQFKRIAKGGEEIWIEGSYNPILGPDGKPFKVMKYATDVTAQRMEQANLQGQIAAINRSQAVIEFTLDGTVLTANANFLNLLGYTLEEIRGKHHGMFVDASYRASKDYAEFWDRLNRGEFVATQFKRIGKGGKEVWIEGSYNPILDLGGKPLRVVKYATDITRQSQMLVELKALIDNNFTDIENAVEQSTQQANEGATAVRGTSMGIQTMASAAEELAASVQEIAAMMAKSKAATEAAHNQTAAADAATQRLAQTSESMTSIVSLIRNIAGQINLLALNASIESARAGDAGKGFAVVAGEVKNLAQQAANATNRIGADIEQMQTVSGEVVAALSGIGKAISQVQAFVVGAASAIEEQSVVTRGMSSDMQSAAATVNAINDNMNEIAVAVGQVSHAVNGTRSAANVLVR